MKNLKIKVIKHFQNENVLERKILIEKTENICLVQEFHIHNTPDGIIINTQFILPGTHPLLIEKI